jgi:phage major head subunit gpT-like protein
MAAITPVFQFDFQRNLNYRFSNAWERTLGDLWFQKITIMQPSASLEELYEWMLETAQIENTNSKGTEISFEDIVSVSHKIKNENNGVALKLNRNDFEDNKYDKAAKWSSDVGSSGAYWPQRSITSLIQAGKTKNGFDGVPFFGTHQVNPYDATSGTYSNLITAKPLSLNNLGAVVASIVSIKGPHGAPRYLKPSVLLVDPTNTTTADTITGAEIITDPTNSGGTAAATNMMKRRYRFGEPIVVPEFSNEPGVYYVGCEANQDAFDGAFIYQERKAFELNSYTGMTQAELDRTNDFEWHCKGRNVAAFGMPYLFFRVEPT